MHASALHVLGSYSLERLRYAYVLAQYWLATYTPPLLHVCLQGGTNTTVFLVLEGEALVSIERDGKTVSCACRRRGDFLGVR